MSDQRNPTRDHPAPSSPRKFSRLHRKSDLNPPFADRALRALVAGLGCTLIAGCPAAAIQVIGEPTAAAIELWVDASAVEGGDGTLGRPFRSLAQALRPDATVHLRSGLYEGPWVLPPGIRLVGRGQVVLFAQGQTTVVTATAATLEGLAVQGGFTGVSATGPLVLRRVHLSGHRRVAVVASGQLTFEDSVLDGTVTETIGVQLVKGSTATLTRLRFTGAFRRAIDAEGARLEGVELTSEGPAQALHLERTTATVRTLTVAGGSGPGIFASQGHLTLTDASVNGHEYGLQARQAKLTITRFSSKRVQLAGIAAVQCTGSLNDVATEQTGTYGALQLLDSQLEVRGVRVKQGRAMGIFVRHGKVQLQDLTIEQIRADADGTGGDGLHFRDAEVVAKNVIIRDAEGVGVFASAAAQVALEKLSCERCRVGVVVAELAAEVSVRGLVSRGGEGPAIVVLDRASATVEDADVAVVQAPIWAECDLGARVTVKRMKSNVPLPASGCIARE